MADYSAPTYGGGYGSPPPSPTPPGYTPPSTPPTPAPSTPTPPATPGTPSTPPSSGFDFASFLNAVTPSASTASLLGIGALGLEQANKSREQYQAYVNKLYGLGQPFVDASQSELSKALSGVLTPAELAQQQNFFQTGQNLQNQAAPWLSQAQFGMQQAATGQLPQWQQQQLENQKAAAIAQATAALGPNADSSSLANVMNNINQQFNVQQGLLNQQNLSTAESEYNIGAQTQATGLSNIAAGYQAAITDTQQAFQNAISLAAQGDQPIESGIQLAIQGDAQIQAALAGLFGSLANAYSYLQSGPGGAKSGTSGSSGTFDWKKIFGGAFNTPSPTPQTPPASPSTPTPPPSPPYGGGPSGGGGGGGNYGAPTYGGPSYTYTPGPP